MSLPLPDLLSLSDDDFLAEAEGRLATLKGLADGVAVDHHYRDQIFPLEQARILRAATREPPLDLLFVTCGAQADSVTLSVQASPARYVALLHTPESEASAKECIQRLGLLAHQAELLPVGDGKDQSEIYRAIFELWQRRGKPKMIAVDVTGGFKTMSAAGAMAGAMLPGGKVHYVDSDQQRVHGRLVWVHQRRITLDNPLVVFGDLEREAVWQLLRDGRWDAAAVRLQALHDRLDQVGDRLNFLVSQGYAALERMNFVVAAQKLEEAARVADIHYRTTPLLHSHPVVAGRVHLRQHAVQLFRIHSVLNELKTGDPLQEYTLLRGPVAEDLLLTLYLLSERLLLAGQSDFSALLSYRVEEGVLQRRLALEYEINASAPEESLKLLCVRLGLPLEQLVARVNRLHPIRNFRLDPTRPVARLEAFVLVAALDPSLARLLPVDRFNGRAEARNRSMLVHGLRPVTESQARACLEQAETLLGWLLSKEGATLEAALAPHRLISLLPPENVDD